MGGPITRGISIAGVVREMGPGLVELRWPGGYVEKDTVGSLTVWVVREMARQGRQGGIAVLYVRSVGEVRGLLGSEGLVVESEQGHLV